MTESIEKSTGVVLWQLSNLWQRKVTEALKPLDLTHVQSLLLAGIAKLNEQGEQVTQNKLAKHAGTEVMMTSKVCRTLQRKGLILRANNRLDTRSKILLMTKSGKAVLEQAQEVMHEANQRLFADLSTEQKNNLHSVQQVISGR